MYNVVGHIIISSSTIHLAFFIYDQDVHHIYQGHGGVIWFLVTIVGEYARITTTSSNVKMITLDKVNQVHYVPFMRWTWDAVYDWTLISNDSFPNNSIPKFYVKTWFTHLSPRLCEKIIKESAKTSVYSTLKKGALDDVFTRYEFSITAIILQATEDNKFPVYCFQS